MMARAFRGAAAAVWIVAVACTSAADPAPTSTTGAAQPSVTSTEPSTTTSPEPAPLVLSQDELGAPDGASAYEIVYRSTGVDGNAVETTGWVAVPASGAAHDILVFAHGTTGLGDECAPGIQISPFLFADYLDAGWTVAFTDYQGLGSDGLHHYLVAEPTAYSLLDVARAAAELDPAATNRVAFLGFSQGGHGVLAATQRAGDLAPDLTIVGTVAAAPAVFIREWVAAPDAAQLGYMGMIATAYIDAYDMDASLWLSPDAIEQVPALADSCLSEADAIMGALGPDAFVADASRGSVVGDLLDSNEAITTGVDTPLLLITGGGDRLFTPEVLDRFIEDMCARDADLRHLEFEEAGHTQLGSLARGPALEWLSGEPVGVEPCG